MDPVAIVGLTASGLQIGAVMLEVIPIELVLSLRARCASTVKGASA
jgi:hypothetical protein